MSQIIFGQTNGFQVSLAVEDASVEFVNFIAVCHKDFQVDGVLEQLWFKRFDLQ